MRAGQLLTLLESLGISYVDAVFMTCGGVRQVGDTREFCKGIKPVIVDVHGQEKRYLHNGYVGYRAEDVVQLIKKICTKK